MCSRTGMISGMARVLILLFILAIVPTLVALISCLSAEEGQVKGLPRAAWVVIILLIPLVGPVAYLMFGRPGGGTHEAHPPRPAHPSTAGRRSVAPDDDPDFLRRLDQKVKRDDDNLLRRWEEDLLRREHDLRRREEQQRRADPDDVPPTDS
jgi:Phospholipase_D-nuclease N-terminal